MFKNDEDTSYKLSFVSISNSNKPLNKSYLITKTCLNSFKNLLVLVLEDKEMYSVNNQTFDLIALYCLFGTHKYDAKVFLLLGNKIFS
jgi:hypothetical protein